MIPQGVKVLLLEFDDGGLGWKLLVVCHDSSQKRYQIFPFGWEKEVFLGISCQVLYITGCEPWKEFRCLPPSQVRLEPRKFCSCGPSQLEGGKPRLESKKTSFQVSFQSVYRTASQHALTCMRDYVYLNEHLLSTDLVPGTFLNVGNSKINMTWSLSPRGSLSSGKIY